MTKKLNFQQKWEKLVEIILDSWSGKLLDVELMSSLDFSPTSWKVWKPKFIEKSRIMEIPLTRNGETKREGLIEYDKKKKLWTIKMYDFEKIYDKTRESYS